MNDALPDDGGTPSQRKNGNPPPTWVQANQRHLSAAMALVRLRLEQNRDQAVEEQAVQALQAAAAAMPSPSAIDLLRASFELTSFETELLLLCAGVELDNQTTVRCAEVQAGTTHRQPTFKLALSCLPGAHWTGIAPGRPLRRFRLIEIGQGDTLTSSPLRIDERVLHYLAGIRGIDERLEDHLEPVERGADLVPSHAALVDRIVDSWALASTPRLPAIELYGPDRDSKRGILAAVCARLNLVLYALPAHVLGQAGDELLLARLITREAVLGSAALMVECEESDGDAASTQATRRLIERVGAPLFLTRSHRGAPLRRRTLGFEVRRPTRPEQLALFRSALDLSSDGGDANALHWIDRVAAQFDLGAPAIRAAGAATRAALPDGAEPGRRLWDACRVQSRTRLDELAQRIDSGVGWDDLALPPLQRRMLEDIALRVRQRTRVYETWGFGHKSTRGLGISALFSGPSGTGKTLAAEVLANELRLDLHRVDLSQVVSKYIGETEKNLRRVFDAADEGATVLLFDEADALFGKRSDVKDSHDRYANVEISYLLQRVEAYRGLAILTTNMRAAVDTAFLRRLAFVVEFPFPDAPLRQEIWRRMFPAATPTEGLDWEQLARLSLAGGNIRNVALSAAFLAADAGEPVRMTHIWRACEGEYMKLERSMPAELTR